MELFSCKLNLNQLFEKSLNLINLKKYDESMFILKYLNFKYPTNYSIIANMIYIEILKDKNITNKYLKYNLNLKCIKNILNYFYNDSEKLQMVITYFEKFKNNDNLFLFLTYLVSVGRYDLFPEFVNKLENKNKLLENVPIRLFYDSSEEIHNNINKYIDILNTFNSDSIDKNIFLKVPPFMYYTSYLGLNDMPMYKKFNEITSSDFLEKDFIKVENYFEKELVLIDNLHNKLKIQNNDAFFEEFIEQILCLKFIEEDDVILEIGGNIGRVSLIITEKLKNDANLVVLECDENNYKLLKENKIKNNKNFQSICAALSNTKLYQYGWMTYNQEELKNMDENIKNKCIEINTISFEKIKNLTNRNFNTLVLDCEGAFYFILKDNPSILKNVKKIIVENDYKNIDHRNYVEEQLIKNNFVKSYGLDLISPLRDVILKKKINKANSDNDKNKIKELEILTRKKYLDFHKNTKVTHFYEVWEKRKIKVGFIQPYYNIKNHSISRMSNTIINQISNNDIESIYIPLNKKDEYSKSEIIKLQKYILNLKLDVLVYCSIGTSLITHLLSFSRLAPIQCNFWGHINTSGKNNIDYYITSELFESEQKYFSEKLVKFKTLSAVILNQEHQLEDIKKRFHKRSFFGISDEHFVCFYPNAIFKLLPETDLYFKFILDNIPNSIIVINLKKKYSHLKNKIWKRFNKTIRFNLHRIIILSFDDMAEKDNNNSFFYYHNMIYISDILLESFPFGGCLKSLDSFYWNKIIIPYHFGIIRGKFTSGFYKLMNMEEILPQNKEELHKLIINIYKNKNYKKTLENKIKKNNKNLYEIDSINEWRQFILKISKN